MKDIEKVSFSYGVTLHMKKDMSPTDIENIVGRGLARGIGKCIIENSEGLPVKKEVIKREETTMTEHRISFYIISAERLKQYQEIERKYFTMRNTILD